MSARLPEPPHSRLPDPKLSPGGSCSEQGAACGVIPRYTVDQLFSGARQLIIIHGGREYRLRLTAANKLILTA